MTLKKIILADNYSVIVDSKKVDGKDFLYTGGKTKIYKNGQLLETFTNIVRGDINGDASINSVDLLAIRRHLLTISILKNEYFTASDVNYDNVINSSDLLRVRHHLLGISFIK